MSTELREALTAAGAGALVPKIIDPMLLEYQRRYSPLVRMVPSIKWDSDTYYFNQRTAVANGGFVTDGGAQPVASSTYVQNSFQIKHLQTVGSVTGYAQAVTRQVIGDLRAKEIEGSIRGSYWDMETAMDWGNSAATLNGPYPQFDGLDTLASIFSGSNQNAIDMGGNTLTLAMLDKIIDMVQSNMAGDVFGPDWMLVGSSTFVSKIAQLQQANQRFVNTVEAEVGLIVPTYRNIPLVMTSMLSARGFGMGTVTAATATVGGVLPASSTYKYVIAPVIARQGEILPSAEVSIATGAGTATNTITLSFVTASGLDASKPILYKVYRTAAGGATGTETLLGVVDANVGLAADGVTPILATSIVDTGAALVPQNGATVPAITPSTYFGTNAGAFPVATGLESVYLISRDSDNLVRPYVREMESLDIYPTTAAPDTVPYALVTDTTMALRALKFVGRGSRIGVAV